MAARFLILPLFRAMLHVGFQVARPHSQKTASAHVHVSTLKHFIKKQYGRTLMTKQQSTSSNKKLRWYVVASAHRPRLEATLPKSGVPRPMVLAQNENGVRHQINFTRLEAVSPNDAMCRFAYPPSLK
jgi:hypothetical protein